MISTNTIERTTVIAADREKIWRALTNPEHFSKWFGADIRWERLEVGALITFDMGSQSGTGKIAAVDKPHRFAFYWTPEAGDPTQTLVTFHLEIVEEGTRVTVTDEGYDALPEKVRRARVEMNTEGWTEQLANIANFVLKTANV